MIHSVFLPGKYCSYAFLLLLGCLIGLGFLQLVAAPVQYVLVHWREKQMLHKFLYSTGLCTVTYVSRDVQFNTVNCVFFLVQTQHLTSMFIVVVLLQKPKCLVFLGLLRLYDMLHWFTSMFLINRNKVHVVNVQVSSQIPNHYETLLDIFSVVLFFQ